MIPGSFRDPSGFLFKRDGVLFRQINRRYQKDYELLVKSGLYEELTVKGLLISHTRADTEPFIGRDHYLVIEPELVPFISYPYEWCFSQLKDAALTTLAVQKTALSRDMSLKDASAYNIQFVGGKPVLIDTLSFEKYEEGRPWIAYSQFCRHFLAPLQLMAYKDIRLGLLLRNYVDGIPLDLASSLMPSGTRLSTGPLLHLHMHARSEKKYADKEIPQDDIKGLNRKQLLALMESLESSVRKLRWKPGGTEWAEYYDETNYSDEAFEHKRSIVRSFLKRSGSGEVWDIGGNDGVFSREATRLGASSVCMDVDPACVEKNYLKCVGDNEDKILPLLIDLFNPSPALGWEACERYSIFQRGPVQTALALALIHHLRISNNVPMPKIASFFAGLCETLIIEFVPKSDSQVQRLLVTREDIFDDYNLDDFIMEFSKLFDIDGREEVRTSERVVFLMRRKK
ncbi:MAG: SAM-dependent methyltransferase [Actinobacteria bacterium]|nr:SAM-dependent methyltransferase [Actinomycetota bacterium]